MHPPESGEIPIFDQYLSTTEVMRIFGKDRQTVLRWGRTPEQDELPFIRIAGRLQGSPHGAVLFDRASVQAEAKRQADALRRQADHLEERAGL